MMSYIISNFLHCHQRHSFEFIPLRRVLSTHEKPCLSCVKEKVAIYEFNSEFDNFFIAFLWTIQTERSIVNQLYGGLFSRGNAWRLNLWLSLWRTALVVLLCGRLFIHSVDSQLWTIRHCWIGDCVCTVVQHLICMHGGQSVYQLWVLSGPVGRRRGMLLLSESTERGQFQP